MQKVWAMFWLLVMASFGASAVVLIKTQNDINRFISHLYSYSADTFEMGEFDGKYQPLKSCLLYKLVVTDALIKKAKSSPGCEPLLIRYPSLGPEDLSLPGALPRPRIGIPKVDGEKASVDVVVAGGKSIFYLIHTSDGWRIENAATYEKWPPTLDGKCPPFFYLVPPTADQRKLEPKECR